MKKFLLGCCLMICGAILLSGVIVACTNIGSGFTEILGGVNKSDWIFLLGSVLVFVVGLLMVVVNIKNDNK